MKAFHDRDDHLEEVHLQPDGDFRVLEDQVLEHGGVAVLWEALPRVIEVPIVAIQPKEQANVISLARHLSIPFIPQPTVYSQQTIDFRLQTVECRTID